MDDFNLCIRHISGMHHFTPLHICGIYHTRGNDFMNYWPQRFYSEEDKE